MADDFDDRWTRANRLAYSDEKNKLAQAGVFAIPRGIGLTDVKAKVED